MLYSTLTGLLNQKRSLEYLSLTVFWPDAKGHAITPNTLIGRSLTDHDAGNVNHATLLPSMQSS